MQTPPQSSSHHRLLLPGIDVHYVHVKPRRVAEGAPALPIILVHGWPGSFYEFYRLIPLLTEPENPEEPVFEVVCPSIPGYGFSEAPHKRGECSEPLVLERAVYEHPSAPRRPFSARLLLCTCVCLQGSIPSVQQTSSRS